MPDHEPQRQEQSPGSQADRQGGAAPAQRADEHDEDRHQGAAQPRAHHQQPESQGSSPNEPVRDRGHRGVGEPGGEAEPDHQDRRAEGDVVAHLAQEQEPGAEGANADSDEFARPESVEEQPDGGREERPGQLVERDREGRGRAGPAELHNERREEGADPVVEHPGAENLHHGVREDDVPAVVQASAGQPSVACRRHQTPARATIYSVGRTLRCYSLLAPLSNVKERSESNLIFAEAPARGLTDPPTTEIAAAVST